MTNLAQYRLKTKIGKLQLLRFSPKARISVNDLVFYSLLLGLFGSVTNFIFVSPLPSFICLLLWPIYISYRGKEVLSLTRFSVFLYLYFIISIISVLFYHPSSLWSFTFYRYDGNFIISYSLLLLTPFLSYNFSTEKKLREFLVFSTVLNLIAFTINVIANRVVSIADWSNPATYFHGLFKSTNAAGGFLSLVLSLNVVLILNERKRKWYLCLVLNFIFLVATTSRGSLLGLLLGGFIYFLYERKHKGIITTLFVLICLMQAIVLYFTYPIFDQYIRDADLTQSGGATGYISPIMGPVETKSANLLIRALDTWPRGLDCFLHSPIIGTGFGSVNDVPLQYSGTDYLISFNSQPIKTFDDSHAHHSYLHILGEQGIVGLGIFLLFWVHVLDFIKKQQKGIVRSFLMISFFNLTIMSFTEHRITSPSNVLPFVITLSLYIMELNRKKIKVFS